MANLTLSDTGRLFIDSMVTDIPSSLGLALQSVNILMAPMYWGVMSMNTSQNGFHISDGSFKLNGKVSNFNGKVGF